MTTMLASFVILLLSMAGLAVGVLAGRKPLNGSCGGLAACGIKPECAGCDRFHKVEES